MDNTNAGSFVLVGLLDPVKTYVNDVTVIAKIGSKRAHHKKKKEKKSGTQCSML